MECCECGLQFLDPLPDQASLDKVYKDYYTLWGIDSSRQEVSEMKKITFRRYLKPLSSYLSKGNLLDVGCATGELMSTARDIGYEVYGVEIAPEGINRCRELFGEERVIGSGLRKETFPQDFFDVITLSDVLEHIPDMSGFLDILMNILKPGGVLLIVTPDTSSWIRHVMGRRWPHYKPEHLYYFNRSNLIRMFSSGFAVLTVGRAYKTLTLDYILSIAEGYNSGPTTGMFGRLKSYLPESWKKCHFTLPIGEIFLLLRKYP